MRNNRIDNIKAVLIMLVLLGHLYEKVSFPGSAVQYFFIYSFHMPLFALLSGYCHKPGKSSAIFKTVLYPYIIAQTLSCLAEPVSLYFISGHWNPIYLRYHTPVWALWYLFALAIWKIFTDSLSFIRKSGILIFALTVGISIWAGFSWDIGYFLSASRIIAFYPFFFCGVWLKKYYPNLFSCRSGRKEKLLGLGGMAAAIGLSAFLFGKFPAESFYNAECYASYGCPWWSRLVSYPASAGVFLFLLMWMPDRKVPILTRVGTNSLFVYLLHTIVLQAVPLERLLVLFPGKPVTVPLFAILLAAALSSKPVIKPFRPLVRWPF